MHNQRVGPRRRIDIGSTAVTQGVILFDDALNIISANSAFTNMTGFSKDDIKGNNFDSLSAYLWGPKTNIDSIAQIKNSLQNSIIFNRDILLYRKDSTEFWCELNILPNKHELKKDIFIIFLLQDISKRKLLEEELMALAFEDPLTKLSTRRIFEDRLNQVMLKTVRSKGYAAIFYIDLDNFKRINDQFGHHIGDLKLVEVAKKLKSCVRTEDTVARIGGDEFLVLMNEMNTDIKIAMGGIANTAKKFVDYIFLKPDLKEYYTDSIKPLDAASLQCSASIGITVFSGNSRSAVQLLEEADSAMYFAKKIGGNQYHFYNSNAGNPKKISPIDKY